MVKFILITIFGSYFNSLCGQNLISNPSLEIWRKGKPLDWEVITNSVDFFKLGYKFVPSCTNMKNKMPKCGYNSNSYLGLADDEIVQCKIIGNLKKGNKYALSFKIYNTDIYTNITSNKFSIFFADSNAIRGIKNNSIKKYKIAYKKNSKEQFDKPQWEEAYLEFEAEGAEKYILLGYFSDINSDLGIDELNIYYLFDDFKLERKNNIFYFENNSSVLNKDAVLDLQDIIKNNTKIELHGYSSTEGDNTRNMDLSKKRIDQVAKEIHKLNKNIQIRKVPHGETFSYLEVEKNRRVEMYFISQEIASTVSCTIDSVLYKTLKYMLTEDQKIRDKYDSLLFMNDKDMELIESRMQLIDSLNSIKIDSIFRLNGYPGISKVGYDLMNAFIILLLHQPYEIRKKYIQAIEQALNESEINRNDYPYLVDRNLLDEEGKQLYGTQCYYDKLSKKLVPYPIKDSKFVNERRIVFRLGTLESYLEFLNKK